MSDLVKAITKILKAKSASPFLFVGSGFSRRYLGLEDWRGLLRRFCADIRDFDYYLASANSDMPLAASLVAKDFHDVWWKSDKYATSREKFKDGEKNIYAALKNEISLYLSSVNLSGIEDEQVQKEITALRSLNVDGIITTNWDFFLEEIFPEYRTFIGQKELLFSNPQAIAEIYKIHGCASQPSSLMLTEEDYRNFRDRNPYLAAKLITLFIEHPIFFLGYSITDPHIQSLIFSIASCLGSEKLEEFSENLIFVRRANGKESSSQKITFSEAGRSVTATVLETDNYCEIYSAIDAGKRKIPARILRYCKEQMYELVKSTAPEKKIAVLDIDELSTSEEVEFVVGVGIAKDHLDEQKEIATTGQKILAENGYKGVSIADLFKDFTREKTKFEAATLLKVAFPMFAKSNATYIPVFRYLKDAGINSKKKLEASGFDGAKEIVARIKKRGYGVKTYKPQYDANWKGKSTGEIIAGVDAERVSALILCQAPNKIDRDALKKFLVDYSENAFRDPYKSFFKKLACYYDRMEFGFEA